MKATARIKEIRFREVRRTLRTTFATSLGQKRHLRSVIVKVTLDDAAVGVGEVPTAPRSKMKPSQSSAGCSRKRVAD